MRNALITTLLFLLSSAALAAEPLQRIAILGDPDTQVPWTDDTVESLKSQGFTTVQLNIAWGSRPFDNPLNLRDVATPPGDAEDSKVTARRADLRQRVDLAKKHGLRTLAHFGSPYWFRNPETGEVKPGAHEAFNTPWFDTENPKLVAYETSLLREFIKQFPDIDDLLIYTYDQDAWQASEFSSSPFSRGVPLDQRLPKYLKTLHALWTDGRPGHTFYWEPWELSAGQVEEILPKLPRSQMGLIIHTNIAEAQIALPADVWYRNTVLTGQDLGIPVIGETFFQSATEELQPLVIPCPALVDESIRAMTAVPVAGLKEYYGVVPTRPDLNRELFTARAKDPAASTADLLRAITAKYGPEQQDVLALLNETTWAMRLYPWDASWFIREVGRASIDHGWSGATIRGQMADTPSWDSTRHARFMKTDDRQPHPWMLEDVQLRCHQVAVRLAAAEPICRKITAAVPDGADKAMFAALQNDLDTFRRVATSFALHLRETNVALLLRQDLEQGKPLEPHLLDELKGLLAADVENQHNHGRVLDMQKELSDAPEKFVRTRLVPIEKTVLERGHFTLTTR